jgi:hypothetical protein
MHDGCPQLEERRDGAQFPVFAESDDGGREGQAAVVEEVKDKAGSRTLRADP